MESEKFDWFDYDIEDAAVVITPENSKKDKLLPFVFEYIFQGMLWIFSMVTPSIFFLSFFQRDIYKVRGIPISTVIEIISIATGTFVIIVSVVKALLIFLHKRKIRLIYNAVHPIWQSGSVSIWLISNYLTMSSYTNSFGKYHLFFDKIFISLIITSLVYLFLSRIMSIFKDYYIKSSLRQKILEVSFTENILHHIKEYTYSDTSSETNDINFSFENTIEELANEQSLQIPEFVPNESPRSPRSTKKLKIGPITIPEPEVNSFQDILRLSRDAFMKSSSGGKTLSKSDFNKIFSHCKKETKENPPFQNIDGTASDFYPHFDCSKDGNISKKEFRYTMVTFYKNRFYLEKAISSTKLFVTALKQLIYGTAFIVLAINYLVIFGIPIKDILAVSVSSALAVNIVASGMFSHVCRNIVIIASHPFDIGDMVLIDNEYLTVYSMGLSSTTFLCSNGGLIKMLNSDLWNKRIINMTKAPEHLLIFKIKFPSNIELFDVETFKEKIHRFLSMHKLDYYDGFTLCHTRPDESDTEHVVAEIVLKSKGYKSKSRTFLLRVEFISFLKKMQKELGWKEK